MAQLYFPEIVQAFPNTSLDKISTNLSYSGSESLPSWYCVSDLAADTMAVAGVLLAQRINQVDTSVHVDRRLASLWFQHSIRAIDWQLPDVWDSIAGNYPTNDGWVRLHTNAKAHKAAALSVLDCEDTGEAVTIAVKDWSAKDLAEAVVAAGGCSSNMHSPSEWLDHPQGKAVASEPLIHWQLTSEVVPDKKVINPKRPLEGIKVLDLTRILAGPVATRFLAGYGADVLRIDPPEWDEPAASPEVTLGKRCASLNLRDEKDRKLFEQRLREADVFVHGYRPGALSNLGYDDEALQQINPRLINVALCAYGWTGPWAQRRGFDSVVQVSCGSSAYGMEQSGAEAPVSLPVQALDHGTGYLIAASVIHALNRLQTHGEVYSARLSLARTACLLMSRPSHPTDSTFTAETEDDLSETIEHTDWGKAKRIKFPLEIEGVPAIWRFPATRLKSVDPEWADQS